jgi:uracil-DNA glycosylase family 4
MGFFTSGEETPEPPIERPKTKRSAITSKIIAPNARGCDSCALKAIWPTITSPKMAISGNNKDADVLCLGEGPGEEEDKSGNAFVGPSGELLQKYIPPRFLGDDVAADRYDEQLPIIKWSARGRIALTNTVRCRPPENRDPTIDESNACSIYLEDDIARLPIGAILGIGGVPLKRFWPGASILAVTGLKFPVRIGQKELWYYPIVHPAFVLRMRGSYGQDGPVLPVFRANMRRFFDEFEGWEKPRVESFDPKSVIIATSPDEVLNVIERMGRPPLGIDLETWPLRPYVKGAKLLSAAVSDGKLTIAWPIHHPEAKNDWGLEVLLSIVESTPWVAHSTNMELLWLRYYARQHDPFAMLVQPDDTMAQVRLYNEREGLSGLDDASQMYLGCNVKNIMRVDAARIMDYPLHDILPYNGLDAEACARLYWKMAPLVNQDHYQALLDRVSSCVDMELFGLPINLDTNAKLSEEWSAKAKAAEESASRLYEVRQYEAETGQKFNIGSGEQVGDALVRFGRITLPRTGKGKQYKTDDEVLLANAPDNPLAQATLAYREAIKIDSTYCRSIRDAINRNVDGVIHSGYNPMLVATYRLQCVAEDTIVETLNGYFSIKELPEGSLVKTHLGHYRRVVRKFIKGREPMFRLMTESGAWIEATAKHELLTPLGWRMLLELKEGDFVYACTSQYRNEGTRRKMVNSVRTLQQNSRKIQNLRSNCCGNSARDTAGLDSSSHRRESCEQPSRQFSSHYSSWPCEDSFALSRIQKIEKTSEREVWDIEVDCDHSYLAQGLIHHNSSGQTNVQNWPKRKHREVRAQVEAPKGHLLIACDMGQLEVRVEAMASRDRNLRKYIIEGHDMHSDWLNRVLKAHPPYLDYLARKTGQEEEAKVRKAGRDIIKADFVFKQFYGGGVDSTVEGTGIPERIVKQLLEEFWAEFKGVRDWLREQRRSYERNGYVSNLLGQKRRAILWGNETINSPIQSVAGQMVLDAQCALASRANKEKDRYLHPRLNVHDDLTFITPANDLEQYIEVIAAEMTSVRYDFQIVPLTVEVKVGENWADLNEVTTIVGDYIR